MSAETNLAKLPVCETLALRRVGPVLHALIDRPATRNALSDAVVADLDRLAAALEVDRTTRVVVLRGAGGTFCAGGDLTGFLSRQKLDSAALAGDNRVFGRVLERLDVLPQILIGVVEGAAFGGGVGLVCVTDIALCEAGTRFAMSETGLGVVPAQIAPFVAARIGRSQARRLALLGERLDGRGAAAIGLVHHVETGTEALEARLAKLLKTALSRAPEAVAATKALIARIDTEPLGSVLDHASHLFAAALAGAEGREGVTAFLEKRVPLWAEQVG
ncbi:enoyl-CoA hydratase-related protein [Brevundimonas sp.]|uniref:enoyl-CoA hydratase/isomerase family protein n=1 Tax=Brevundimonas sp. TaxID=1871086 RepID=UPI0024891BB7|nr:enoyl-CoA hydratase-related protein [Brevundimonas sp.]MDI1281787.1 enoyl-CoA hydratase-related protein [Brevundimonas sp.]